MKAMFDSNILMDYLNKVDFAREILRQHKTRYISIVTYIEVLVGAKGAQGEIIVRGFLNKFKIVDISSKTADLTVKLIKEFRFKSPDALIVATSLEENMTLFTRDETLFDKFSNVVCPYQL